MTSQSNHWLHRFACLTAFATFILIIAGASVTSNRAGLAVPDWPTTYGHLMFFFPFSKMVGGIFYEHGHRLIASTVGILTIVLAVWLVRTESRRWLRWLGIVALAAVIAQGILGGLTVRYLLPASISIAHAGLAQAFFCMTIALAVFTSAKWTQIPLAAETSSAKTVRGLAMATTIGVYLQLILGASIRHSEAGLTAHVVGAIAVTACVAWLTRVIFRSVQLREFLVNVLLLLLLVALQLGLGLATLLVRVPKDAAGQLSTLQILLPTAHLAVGALILGASFALTLRGYRFLVSPREDVAAAMASEAMA